MLTLHGRADSSNVQKVVWGLEEIGADYERRDVGGAFGGLDEPAFRRLSPPGKVPALEDGNVGVFESHVILRHLGRTRAGEMWPDRDPARLARAEAVMDWTAGAFWGVAGRVFVPVLLRGKSPDDPAVAAALEELPGLLDILGAMVADGWAAGETFTFADIPPAVFLQRIRVAAPDMDLPPAVADWHARCADRPAYRRAVFWGAPPA